MTDYWPETITLYIYILVNGHQHIDQIIDIDLKIKHERFENTKSEVNEGQTI